MNETPAPEAATKSVCLEARSLNKIYGRQHVVHGVSLEVKQGEVVGLLGPNGAGKTTTFYMMVGFIRPSSGEVIYDGESITRLPMYQRARMGVGYLPQETSIFRKLTVEENLLAILELRGCPKLQRAEITTNLLKELGVSHLRDRPAQVLSGGETRRVEIARALASSPRFLLLDEPFTGVDPIAVQDIQQIVGALKERNIGVLITDHNVRETLEITDRGYIMHQGQIMTSGTAEELVNDPLARQFYFGEQF